MTEQEYLRRRTTEHTNLIACRCLYCNFITEVSERKADGVICPSCGRQAVAIGYIKPEKWKPKREIPLSFTISESAEQQNLLRWSLWAEAKYPELCLLYHVPNEGKRSRAAGGRLKAEGMKPGVPDLCLPVARCGFHGLYIELKAQGGKPTANQKQWIEKLTAQGYLAKVCVGFESAQQLIESYLKGEIVREV